LQIDVLSRLLYPFSTSAYLGGCGFPHRTMGVNSPH
jgi:hypothetical protein